MSYFDAEEDASSLVALSCASFVLDLEPDSPCPSRPPSPAKQLAAAPIIREPPRSPSWPLSAQHVAREAKEDSVQALIRRVELGSLTSGKPEQRRDGSRRRRGDIPPRFRPSTPSSPSYPSTSSAPRSPIDLPRSPASAHAYSPVPPDSPRGAPAPRPAGGRQGFARQIDVHRANRLAAASAFGPALSPSAVQSAPAIKTAFTGWPLSSLGERSQSPPFSDCSTISSSSSSLHSPFDAHPPRTSTFSAGYPFPSPPRKSSDDWAADVARSGLPSLEMIQQRVLARRADGVENPTCASFASGGGRQRLPSFLIARRQLSEGSSASLGAPVALVEGGFKTPPLDMQDGPRVFVTPPPSSL